MSLDPESERRIAEPASTDAVREARLTPAEAVERANNSAYGLAAGVWTDNGAKAFEVASKLRAGVVWQNTYNKFDPTAAFGGYKESGFGREGGSAGLLPYVRITA